MTPTKNHYDLLGISRAANAHEIKAAYRKQIKQHHPDRLLGKRAEYVRRDELDRVKALDLEIEQAKAVCQQLNLAYGVLSDPYKRQLYDMGNRPRYSGQTYKTPDTPRHTTTYTTRHAYGKPSKTTHSKNWLRVAGVFFTLTFLTSIWNMLDDDKKPYETSLQGGVPLNSSYELEGEQKGDIAYAQQQYNEAILYYNSAISFSPEYQIYYKRGLAYRGLNDQTSALADFSLVILIEPTFADVYRERGLLYFERWQQTQSPVDRTNALADLTHYQTLAHPQIESQVTSALMQMGQ